MDIEDHLRKFRLPDPEPGLRPRVLRAVDEASAEGSSAEGSSAEGSSAEGSLVGNTSSVTSRGGWLPGGWIPAWPLVSAAAAVIALAAGLGLWSTFRAAPRTGTPAPVAGTPSEHPVPHAPVPHAPENPPTPPGEPDPRPPVLPRPPERPAADPRAVSVFAGQGRMVPVGADTEFTVLDPDAGRVRLDRGELLVDVPAGEGRQAEVRTPVAGLVASGNRFHARFDPGTGAGPVADSGAHPGAGSLTVAVLAGSVEVVSPRGRTVGEADEVLTADAADPPRRRTADAARGGRGRPGRGGPLSPSPHSPSRLLWRPEVVADLGLTPEQTAALRAGAAEEWVRAAELFRDLHDLPGDQQAARFAEFHRRREQRLAAVLTPQQRDRLRQLSLQREGPAALTRPEIADALGLDPGQRTALEATARRTGERMTALYADAHAGLGREEFARRRAALQSAAAEEIAAVLTEAQADAWRGMLGPPPAPHDTHRSDPRGSPDRRRPGSAPPQP